MNVRQSVCRLASAVLQCCQFHALQKVKGIKMNIGISKEYISEFHSAAASGDASRVTAMLQGRGLVGNVDVTNDKGWTALMFAARNGHKDVVKTLLEKGSNKTSLTVSGQTALDIAKFWNHQDVMELLEPGEKSVVQHLPHVQETVNFFSPSLLDRAAHLRKDDAWIKQALTDPQTKFVVFSKLEALIMPNSDDSSSSIYKLCIARSSHVTKHLQNATYVFLGTEKTSDPAICIPWFAIDLSSCDEGELKAIHPEAELTNLFSTTLQFSKEESGMFAQGKSMLAWHDRYGFCPTCGSRTKVAEGGYKRVCSNSDCRSLTGIHNTSYPRVDPSVIMAVGSVDGKRLLLGRGKRFPRGLFSCLAGFMEPGESMEDACRREVFEESGVKVGPVEYHSCQPWPMPCSLLLGCLAQAKSDRITIDKEELEEAKWFSRQEVLQMINHSHPQNWYCPPPQTIAHSLIKSWLSRTPASGGTANL